MDKPKEVEVVIAICGIKSGAPIENASGGIRTRSSTQQYRDGWDAIFGKGAVSHGEQPTAEKTLN